MYKVLIADDEQIVLEGMRLFPWNEMDCVLVGEATDGRTALEMSKQLMPDIVFTDINMPDMDGLEFAKELHNCNSEIAILIFTGHLEFSYAYGALKIGVMDFLLKPVTFPVIKQALAKTVDALKKQYTQKKNLEDLSATVKKMQPLIGEQLLLKALRGENIDSDDEAFAMEVSRGKLFIVASVCNDNAKNLESYVLPEIIERHLADLNYEWQMIHYDYRYVFLFIFPRLERVHDDYQAEIRQCFESIQLNVWKLYHFTFSVGISSVGTELKDIFSLNRQAMQVLLENRLDGKNFVSSYSGEKFAYVIPPEQLRSILGDVHICFLSRDSSAISAAFYKLVELVAKNAENSTLANLILHNLWLEILFMLHANEEDKIFEKDALEKLSVQEYAASLEKKLLCLNENLRDKDISAKKEINVIVSNYIKEHYTKDISLTTLSEELCYSTAYLSRLIGKYCDKNFMTMLIDIRMEKAKEMLLKTELPVRTISEKVGYKNEGYFTTAFKSHENCTPAEFRIKNL